MEGKLERGLFFSFSQMFASTWHLLLHSAVLSYSFHPCFPPEGKRRGNHLRCNCFLLFSPGSITGTVGRIQCIMYLLFITFANSVHTPTAWDHCNPTPAVFIDDRYTDSKTTRQNKSHQKGHTTHLLFK